MRLVTLTTSLLALITPIAAQQDYVNYESNQVHPIALSADGKELYVTNTADNRLNVFSLADPYKPVLVQEVFVGMEPISVRPRTKDEVWVVNFVSDSISVVSLTSGRVTATIYVPDEPTDVIFTKGKAFVSVAGSDEIRVFDEVTHKLLKTISVFGDEPRSLEVSGDGSTLWAVVHRSGNETTLINHHIAPPQPKPTNTKLPPPPKAALIVHSEDKQWTSKHDVDLPDYDLVEIDVSSMSITQNYSGIGTINTGIARQPGSNTVWVANTDARNLVRFEPNLRGHAWDNRVTKVNTSSGKVTPFDLNTGINYKVLPNSSAMTRAIASPTDIAWGPLGLVMYIAALGTDRIAIVSPAGKKVGWIEVGNTSGTKVDSRNKRGPRGLAMHPKVPVLYVFNALSNSITLVDTSRTRAVAEVSLTDPTPTSLKEGRGFMYDAKLSGNGTFSCASCHVAGDQDGLAWDLGDPGGSMMTISTFPVHPMKGPLTTQSLRGLRGTAPYHKRGDRPRLEDFNGAFDSLMGGKKLSGGDIGSFASFMRTINYPSNPNLKLDRSLPNQSARDGFVLFTKPKFSLGTCSDCHTLGTGTNGQIFSGPGLQEPQPFKALQLRDMYKRTEMRKTSQGRKSGFGVMHDGRFEDTFAFFGLPVFGKLSNDTISRQKLQSLMEAFDTETAPTVGYQVMVTSKNITNGSVLSNMDLLMARAMAGDIDLIGKGVLEGWPRGTRFDARNSRFEFDSTGFAPMTWAELKQRIQKGPADLMFMGAPRGTGRRLALDRDRDGTLDGDEGVVFYGNGTKGCGGIPTIGVLSPPKIGNSKFAAVGQNAPKGGKGLMAISLVKGLHNINGLELLVSLSSPTSLFLKINADSRGEFVLAWSIPNNNSLVGVKTFNQFIWVDTCAPSGLSASVGMQVNIGR